MARTMIVYARSDCPFCHGSGQVTDWVPYGSGNVPMDFGCECATADLDMSADEWAVTVFDIRPSPDYMPYDEEGLSSIEGGAV